MPVRSPRISRPGSRQRERRVLLVAAVLVTLLAAVGVTAYVYFSAWMASLTLKALEGH